MISSCSSSIGALREKTKAGEKPSQEDVQKLEECMVGVRNGVKENCGEIFESLEKCNIPTEAKKLRVALHKCAAENKLGERS